MNFILLKGEAMYSFQVFSLWKVFFLFFFFYNSPVWCVRPCCVPYRLVANYKWDFWFSFLNGFLLEPLP